MLDEPLLASRRLLLLDYLGAPYDVVGDAPAPDGTARYAIVGRRARTRHLRVYVAGSAEGVAQCAFRLGEIPLFGSLVPTATTEAWLRESGSIWTRETPIVDTAGREISWIWRSPDGSVFLPFDPDELIRNFWSETYQSLGKTPPAATISRLGKRAYYWLRPLLGGALRIAVRRIFSRLQGRASFPRWPVEPALHDLYDVLFCLIEEIAGAAVPWIAPWPAGYDWALVLTHDVELADGLANIRRVVELEESLGYRSSWNLVGRRYDVDQTLIDALLERGFEVGVHGLRHDGRDLQSLATLERRLPEMRELAARWRSSGFRSPATHRVWEWMPLLGFDYDSSYPDTDPYEPQAGGCCSWLPFLNDNLVELPMTLPQDYTLFVVLRQPGPETWIKKAEFLRSRGGMALLDTHPDYMLGASALDAYRAFLERFVNDESAWRALPRDVAAWWRRRAASHLEPGPGGWQVVGPAADEAAVRIGNRRARE